MALGGWFSFDAPLVSFLFFAEPTSEVTATFHAMSSSCWKEAWGISESLSPALSHRDLPVYPFRSSLTFSFSRLLRTWSFKKDKAKCLTQGGSKSKFVFLPACRFRLQGAAFQMYSSGTCAYIQRGAVFAENCILTAFSICQKKANLLTVQWMWRLWKKRRRPLNFLLKIKLYFVT